MQPLKKAYLQLHIAVLIFGFTAIIGKLITVNHFSLVWHRMWIAAVSFFFLPGFIVSFKALSRKHLFIFSGIGCLVAIHWITFYGSIKIGGSASLTLGCFGLTSAFASILEPVLKKKKIDIREVMLGLLALTGIIIISLAKPANAGENYGLAIFWGIFSTFVAALFSTINSIYIIGNDARAVTFTELGAGFLFLTLLLPFLNYFPDFRHFLRIESFHVGIVNNGSIKYELFHTDFDRYLDFLWIPLLAVGCTTIAFVMNLEAMKHVSAFTANLAINLEPVYGILLAAIIFSEHHFLNTYFYIGTSLILVSVFIHPFIKKKTI